MRNLGNHVPRGASHIGSVSPDASHDAAFYAAVTTAGLPATLTVPPLPTRPARRPVRLSTRGLAAVTVCAAGLLLAGVTVACPLPTSSAAAPERFSAPRDVYEDDPVWDCRVDGNGSCGPGVTVTTSASHTCVAYRDGSGVCTDAAGNRTPVYAR